MLCPNSDHGDRKPNVACGHICLGQKSNHTSEESLTDRKERFKKVIELLQLSSMYNLERTASTASIFFEFLMMSYVEETRDLYEVPILKTLVDVAFPLKEIVINYDNGASKTFLGSSNKAGSFFDVFINMTKELHTQSIDQINSEMKSEMFPLLLLISIEREAKLTEVNMLRAQMSRTEGSNTVVQGDVQEE